MLDGAAKIDKLLDRVAEYKMPGTATTNHGNIYDAYEFHDKARARGLNPIIGSEIYLAPGSRFNKEKAKTPEEQKANKYSHMTLLAMDAEGYSNLSKISSEASLTGYYFKARADRELLQTHNKGLVATSGCVGGEIAQLIYKGRYDEAKIVAGEMSEIFGKGNFFIEIMRHNIEIENTTGPGLIRLAKELNLPLLATNDLHYVDKKDHAAHDALLCIQTDAKISDQDRFRFESQEFYLKTAKEMRALFSDVPEACDNTLLINERANVVLERNKQLLPKFPVPDGHTQETYLRERVELGIERRYGSAPSKEVTDRVEYELSIINKMGFPAYFSIVEDLINHAREVGIRTGPGRGSAPGSILSYALGITGLDPIEHGLLFERFLNPDRISMPDIDIDFDERRRSEMITYSTERYGEEHVAQIVTYGSIKAKNAMKDAARVLGLPYVVGEKLSKSFPPAVMGSEMKLSDCFDKNSKRYSEAKEIRELYETDPESKTVIDLALGLEGLKRQVGVHAAGIIISGDPIIDHVPVWRRPADGAVITQFDGPTCESIGLLKMDFLGLRNLTILDDALDNIKLNRGETVVLEDLGLDDELTYKLLQSGNTIGVFQLEGAQMRSLMRLLAPENFGDISALIALYRPGPMGMGSHLEYAERKNGRKEVVAIHPELEEPLQEILGETFGLCVFQEQVMAAAQKVAGYSLGGADILRRVMGKKKKEELDKQYTTFYDGMKENGYSDGAVEALWNTLLPFAGYAFNKSHSAAYGVISYWTAYLKAHYPAEYLAALLTSVKDDKDKLALYLNECRRLGITVLSPDVNESEMNFTPVGENIRFGLSGVRAVGEGVVAGILEAKANKGNFESFEDYVKKVPVQACNKRAVESLIKSGAFDSLDHKRLGLTLVAEEILASASKSKKAEAVGQFDLFSAFGVDIMEETVVPNKEWDQKTLLAFEREMLGLYVSAHPLDGVDLSHESPLPIAYLIDDSIHHEDEVKIGGLVTHVEHRISRAGKPWASATIEDKDGSIEVVFFGKNYDNCKALLIPDEIIILVGRIDKSNESDVKIIGSGVRTPFIAPEVQEQLSDYSNIIIVLEDDNLPPALVQAIKKVLHDNPGEMPVQVELASGRRFPVPNLPCSGNYPARLKISSIPGVKEILFI